MPESILERYERILRADPSSRVFVELARALLDRGEPARAVELCARGVQHHPDSVLARIVWGRALLTLGQPEEASAQLELATRIDEDSPYAYDLAGEALVGAGEFERARALLERGAERHPRDLRIQLWIQRASTLSARRPEGQDRTPAVPPPSPGASPPPLAAGSQRPVGAASPPPLVAASPPPLAPASPPPLPAPRPVDLATDADGTSRAAQPPTDDAGETRLSSPVVTDATLPTARAATDEAPPAPEASPEIVVEVPPAAQASSEMVGEPLPPPQASPETVDEPLPPPQASSEMVGEPLPARQASSETIDGTRLPAQSPAPPPQGNRVLAWARHHVGVLALITVALASSVGVATFLVVRSRERIADAKTATEAARAGLARDTLGSLLQASAVLSRARKVAPHDPETAALLAEVSALLAYDFGDADARSAARDALASMSAGRGTYATRWLVAGPSERDEAAGALLANRNATPLASTIAGQVLLSLGDLEGARASFERASNERPPMLRAVTLLGDLDLARGELGAARGRYEAVLRVQATHPRAALGIAEVSLAAGAGLAEALDRLEKVSGDRDSSVPLQDRLRFDLLKVRLLVRNGRGGEALPILDAAAGSYPGHAEIAAARAEVLASSGDLAGAMAAARTALVESRGDDRYRALVADLQLRQGRYADLLAGTEKEPTRALRTYRCRARLALGDIAGARGEIEASRRDGKMTPEGAAWAALVEIAAGRAATVTRVVDALLDQPLPPPAALLAGGRLDLQGGRHASAERQLRDAMSRDPDLLDARVALSELLVETNRNGEAVELMRATVARFPSVGMARVALARALVANGQREEALAELAALRTNPPEDAPANAAARQLLRTIRRTGRGATPVAQ